VADILFHPFENYSMKKIYLLLGLVSYQSFSQDSQKSTQVYNEIALTATIKKTPDNERMQSKVWLKKNGVFVKAYLNNIPSAVMADFIKRYTKVQYVNWKVDDDQVNGYFDYNNEKVAVTYKKNGYLLSTRKTYDSVNLSKSLRIYIQAELNKGFQINTITEVISGEVTLYEINLVDQQQICIVRLSKNKGGAYKDLLYKSVGGEYLIVVIGALKLNISY